MLDTARGFKYDEPDKKRYSMGTLLDKAVVDYRHEATGDILVSWYFGRLFIEMAERSNHWAILDRQTVFHLQSKYSVLLFQYFASLQNLKHKTGEVFTVDQLRSILGVEQGKLVRFADLNARALQPAIAEINQLARFTLTATLRKTGRTVTSVEISWEIKPDLTKAKRELDSSKVGRKSRRSDTSDAVVLSFPATGSISYDKPFADIARTHGSGKDINLIAQDFRTWAKGKFELDDVKILSRFEAFCKKVTL